MYQQRRLGFILSIVVCFLLHAQGADKFTDENRPYEFGFKVDGQQHRHEKKDKDGIIMGEFGFITADDVYHVTVYATDKEGRFKILSMKNIHLKASPAGPSPSARQGHSLALPPAPAAAPNAPPPPVSQAHKPFESVSLEPPGRSCSSCSIPTTTPRAPPPAPPSYNQANNNYNSPGQFNTPQQGFAPTYQQGGNGGLGGQPNYPSQQNYVPQGPNPEQAYPQQFGGQQNYPGQAAGFSSPAQGPSAQYPYAQGTPAGQNYPEEGSGSPPNHPSQNESPQYYPVANNYGGSQPGLQSSGYPPQPGSASETQPGQGEQQYPSGPYSAANSGAPGGSPSRSPKQYNGPEQQFSPYGESSYPQGGPGQQLAAPAKPTLLSAQMQIVDKNTDIHHLNSGEKEGLPAGLSKHDMVRLLYTFNYTLGFQGHFEEGYNNGVKKGYYFVTGRNGVRMRIDYVADDTGFHPKVSQDVLDVLSDDVPKPETEKDAKYGLKGYEFKWLYYPVDSKRR